LKKRPEFQSEDLRFQISNRQVREVGQQFSCGRICNLRSSI
jgi:hypothetical protein